jgi:hypothetical protein
MSVAMIAASARDDVGAVNAIVSRRLRHGSSDQGNDLPGAAFRAAMPGTCAGFPLERARHAARRPARFTLPGSLGALPDSLGTAF